MSPRQYRLGKRAETIEQTRERILGAARELLAQEGYHSTSLDQVARAADVARATVYYQFGSKPGLLEAVVEDIRRRAGQADVDVAVELTDPVEGVRQAFVTGSRFWSAERALVRRLTGLAAVDDEIGRVLADVGRNRLPLLDGLVKRLDAAGQLAPSVSEARALDVLWMLSSFEAFDQLFTGRQLPVEQVGEVLADLAVHAVARTRDAGSRGT